MLRFALLVLLFVSVTIGAPGPSAAQTPSLNWGSEVNPAQCPNYAGYRYLEINVTRDVQLDAAPGAGVFQAASGWADREYNQHIQVWKIGVTEDPPPGVGAEHYCALVRYQGSWVSNGTGGVPNPSSGGMLAEGVDGTFEGGYRLVFYADENFMQSTRGRIDGAPMSTSAYDWLDFYFMNRGYRDPSGTLQTGLPAAPSWWGWVYHGGHNGSFVNSKDGAQGNITGGP
jgi:hypothetical protein